MRLLVVSQYFWPEVFRVNEIVSELSRRGHQVTVLTGRPNYPEGRIPAAYASEPQNFSSYHGAQILRVPLRPRGTGSLNLLLNYWSFVFWGCLLGPWLLRGKSFDAIFVFETSPITSALPAIVFKRFKRAPMTMWVLDLWPDTLAAVGMVRSPALLAAVGQLCSFIYRHCDLILGQSRAFAEPIARWSRAPAKFRYFPAWAEADFDDAESAAPAPELGRFQHDFKVVFAGNLGDAQDLPAVIAAARITRERGLAVQWLLVGDGRAAERTREQIAADGLQDCVHLLGRYPQSRMPGFFKGADALLVSLKREPIFAMTIPGKVQSYLAAGRPVLAMLDGEGARVVSEAEAGFAVPAGNSAALADRVWQLANMSPDERNDMGRRGRAYCKAHFDRDAVLQQLEGWLASPQHA